MTERETIESLLAINKRDSSYLAAFEALGKVIEDLKSDIRSRDFRIAELERKLAEEEEASNVQKN